jgi:hypothetical protein
MFTNIVWIVGMGLVGLLLVRCVQQKLYKDYLTFCMYVFCMLVIEIARLFTFLLLKPTSFSTLYWSTDLFLVGFGYAIIFEVYQRVLGDYPGPAKAARNLLAAILAIVAISALFGAFHDPGGFHNAAALFERNLRIVQGIALVVGLVLCVHFCIPIGRNMTGIIFGYTFFIGTSVINLTYVSHLRGRPPQILEYLLRFSYQIALVVWTASLWRRVPVPKPRKDIRIEKDYQAVAEELRRAITRARGRMRGGMEL